MATRRKPAKKRARRTLTLTEEDRNTMRTFKLDPDNREHVLAYAKAKWREVNRVPDAKVATDRMRNRTPLRLTAEDEAIMREDWLLDPDKLPQVRIYQELLKFQRENQTLRAQVAERDERLEERDFAEVPVHETDGSGVARRAPPPVAATPPLYFLTAEGMREYIWLGDRWVIRDMQA